MSQIADRRNPRPRWLWLLTVLVCTAAVSAAHAAAANAAGNMSWAAPVSIDNQPPYFDGTSITAVSCPSASLCVAVDANGDAITSTDPTGGFAAWTIVKVAPFGLVGVSCPTTTLCVAVDDDYHVYTSTDPTGGAGSWTSTRLSGGPYTAISCASTTLCVAVDELGDIAASTDPTGGSAAWDEMPALAVFGFTDVSCTATPTVMCAAVSDLQLATSTDPAGGSSAWTVTDIPDSDRSFSSISCPSATLCVGGGLNINDPAADVVTVTDPTSEAPAWSETAVDPGQEVTDVSCASPSLCFAFDSVGNVLTSTDPTGGVGAWTLVAGVDNGATIQAASCVSVSLCVGVDSDGDVLASTDPTGDADAWTVTSIDGSGGTIEAVSCVSAPQCVAVDDAGDVISTSDPAGGASEWSLANVDGANAIFDVSCPTTTLCVAVDAAGNVITSSDPLGGAGAWAVANVDGRNPLGGVSCPTATLCVAIDLAGNVVTSTDPTGGPSAWQDASIDAGNAFLSVSCASTSLCVAVDDAGDIATSTDPAGGGGSWTVADVDGDIPLTGVSCAPGTTVCVAAAADGTLLASSDPQDTAWSTTAPLTSSAFDWVSCASASLCVAVDAGGDADLSPGPASGDSWVPSFPDDSGPSSAVALLGVSCTTSLCVAVDADGNVVTGTPPNPASSDVLDVALAGDRAGVVTATGLGCPLACAASYVPGTEVTLTATSDAGSQFAGWSGSGCTGTGSCSVTLTSDATVTATFEPTTSTPLPSPNPTPAPPTLIQPVVTAHPILSVVGAGTVSNGATTVISCPERCAVPLSRTPVTLTASPATGWAFAGWGGICSGASTCAVPTNATGTVTATFTAIPGVTVSKTRPADPVISALATTPKSATFTFAKPSRGTELECALVRVVAGRGAERPKPVYTPCGTKKTYRHLHKGSYTLYVRSVATGGMDSTPVERSFKIR